MRAECESGAAAWLLGTLAVPSAQDMDCLHHKSYGAIRVFFQASCCCRSEALFGQSFSSSAGSGEFPCLGSVSVFRRVRHTKGPPCLGSYSVDGCIKHLREHPGWGPTLYFSASGVCRGSLSIVQLPMPACGERVAMVMIPPYTVTQQYRLASMAARLSSTGISHHNLLPHIPSIHLSAVNSSPHSTGSRIAPQSLNSSSQLLHLPGDPRLCPGYAWLWKD